MKQNGQQRGFTNIKFNNCFNAVFKGNCVSPGHPRDAPSSGEVVFSSTNQHFPEYVVKAATITITQMNIIVKVTAFS